MNVDTLAIARDLRATELPPAQAEAIAAAIGRSVSEGTVTKLDLEVVEQRLSTRIETVRTDVERARNQVVLRVVGSQITLAGLILALLKL